MNKRFYLAVMVCVAIAVAANILGPSIAKWIASSTSHPDQQQILVKYYNQSFFAPLSRPAQPLPLFLEIGFKHKDQYGLYAKVYVFLFWLQVALLVRRFALSVSERGVHPPRLLNRGWKVVLWLCLASWLLGTIGVIVPRLLFPLLGGDLPFVQGLAFALAIGQAFVVPFVWLLSSNLFGLTFFLIEALSVVKEGVLPRPNTAVNTDAAR